MKSILTKIMAAALAVSVSTGMSIVPSLAESNGGMGFQGFVAGSSGHHYRSHRHYRHHSRHHHRRHYRHGRHYRHYRHHHDNGAGVVGGLITGAIIGGIAANALGNRGGGNAHVRWCYDHYRSYRASDNTYQPYHGPRRQCNSPY